MVCSKSPSSSDKGSVLIENKIAVNKKTFYCDNADCDCLREKIKNSKIFYKNVNQKCIYYCITDSHGDINNKLFLSIIRRVVFKCPEFLKQKAYDYSNTKSKNR